MKYNEICECESKNYSNCKKGYSWNPSTYIVRIVRI